MILNSNQPFFFFFLSIQQSLEIERSITKKWDLTLVLKNSLIWFYTGFGPNKLNSDLVD